MPNDAPPAAPTASRPPALHTLAAYGAMLGGAVAIFLAIRSWGEALGPGGGETLSPGRSAAPASRAFLHVLLALTVVIIASRCLGALFRLVRQPPVIGEVVAGLLLGPSVFGRLAPEAQAFVLPAAIGPHLGVVAEVGVILFLFLVGMELNTGYILERARATIAISHASIAVPFLCGSALALWLYPVLAPSEVGFTSFALFMGVSMSVTAFPVLARILTDSGLQRTPLGTLALACAAVGDATAWCLLAAVVGIVRPGTTSTLLTLGLTFGYVALLLAVVRPLVGRALARIDERGELTRGATAAVLIGLLLSALATEAIGIHALFGAFLLGAVIPHDSLLAREVARKLEDLVVVLFLPAFFAFTGLRTDIGRLASAADWALCGVIIAVACAGKFGGSAIAARLHGLPWRDASALGVLMNTRGLMELVVLNVGLDLGVISAKLFAMLVIMAVVTTLATAPILHAIVPRPRAGSASSGPG